MSALHDKARAAGIHLDWLGGNCPVQAEGMFDGLFFYFRARGEQWQFHVGRSQDLVMVAPVFRVNKPYVRSDGAPPEWGAAGWMPEDEALDFIIAEVAAFRERRAKWMEAA